MSLVEGMVVAGLAPMVSADQGFVPCYVPNPSSVDQSIGFLPESPQPVRIIGQCGWYNIYLHVKHSACGNVALLSI